MLDKGEFVTSLELADLNARANEVWYRSKFLFLNAHKGYRRGNMHLLLGASGGGKSTLTRSMVIDALPRVPKGKKVLVWLSEETADDFKMEIAKTGIIEHGRVLMDRLDVYSEQDSEIKGADNFLEHLKQLSESGDYDIIFVDNITTSGFYMDRRPNEQAEASKFIKKICQTNDIPFILIAHTGAEISDSTPRMINPNDVRGSKTIINLTQFIYILQRFVNDEVIYQSLRICKNRGQDVKDKLYVLTFDINTFLFLKDRAVSFEAFKDAFKKRDVLR